MVMIPFFEVRVIHGLPAETKKSSVVDPFHFDKDLDLRVNLAIARGAGENMFPKNIRPISKSFYKMRTSWKIQEYK